MQKEKKSTDKHQHWDDQDVKNHLSDRDIKAVL